MKMNKTSYLKVAIRSAVSLSLFFILFLLFGTFFFKNGLSSDLIGGCLFMCIVSSIWHFILIWRIIDITPIDSERFMILGTFKTLEYSFSRVEILWIGKANRGYFEIMLDNTIYWVSATETNFTSVCTIIERCKSSKITLEEFIEMKERRKWAWME